MNTHQIIREYHRVKARIRRPDGPIPDHASLKALVLGVVRQYGGEIKIDEITAHLRADGINVTRSDIHRTIWTRTSSRSPPT